MDSMEVDPLTFFSSFLVFFGVLSLFLSVLELLLLLEVSPA